MPPMDPSIFVSGKIVFASGKMAVLASGKIFGSSGKIVFASGNIFGSSGNMAILVFFIVFLNKSFFREDSFCFREVRFGAPVAFRECSGKFVSELRSLPPLPSPLPLPPPIPPPLPSPPPSHPSPLPRRPLHPPSLLFPLDPYFLALKCKSGYGV